MAEIHVSTALAAYAAIFPPEAPKPTVSAATADWVGWLTRDPSRQAGFVAGEGGRLVGVVLAGPDHSEPDVGHISRMYVMPRAQGRGIGSSLYEAARAYLVSSGFSDATLWVLERNEHARSWYERLGWEPSGEQKAVYAPAGIVDVHYRARLAAVPALGGESGRSV